MNKFLLKSKTIIGIIVGFLPTLLPHLGVSFSADDAAFISAGIDDIWLGLSAMFAFYGRIDAGGISLTGN